MRLKLFSDVNMASSFTDDFTEFLALDEPTQKAIVDAMLHTAKTGHRLIPYVPLEKKLSITREKLDSSLDVVATVAARVLSGKSDSAIQEDLIAHGFNGDQVKRFFDLLIGLSETDKNALRHYALMGNIEKDHWHYINFEPEIRSVMDKTFLLGTVVLQHVEIDAHMRDTDEEDIETWSLEMDLNDLQRLITGLEEAKKQLEQTEKSLKLKFGDDLITCPGV